MGLSPNTIQQGDCLEHLRQLPQGSVDLVFADPPFNIGYEYDVYDDRRAADDYIDWCRQWMRGVYDGLKPNGSFWLAIGDEFAAELKVEAQRNVGFHTRSWVIWYYTFGVNCVRGFSRSHTHLFHFVKDPDDFTFNANNPTVRVPSARQLVYADARANPKGRLPDNTWILRPQDVPPGGFAPQHDTWYYSRVAGTFKERQGFHGCQMPEQLLGRIIRISSNPMDVVLDPFSGSGTTLAVAKKLGRQYLGFELSKEYVTKIEERLTAIQPGDELVGPADPIASAPTTKNGKSKVKVRNGKTVPHSNAEMERGLIAAYQTTHQGLSTDHLLCDPELQGAFLKECKRLGLEGSPFVWNRVLLRLRKAGKLTKHSKRGNRLSFAEMDDYSFASEIAMQLMHHDYGMKLDDILCSPDAVTEFDSIAHQFAPGFNSFLYRWAAMALRKRAKSSRQLAVEQFADWQTLPLPPSQSLGQTLAQQDAESLDEAGVYILSNTSGQTIYIGETQNIAERLNKLNSTEAWRQLNITTMQIISCEASSTHGLQSALVTRLHPWLNSNLLKCALDFPARKSFVAANQ